MFMLLTGEHPFYEKNDTAETFAKKVADPKFKFPSNLSKYRSHTNII